MTTTVGPNSELNTSKDVQLQVHNKSYHSCISRIKNYHNASQYNDSRWLREIIISKEMGIVRNIACPASIFMGNNLEFKVHISLCAKLCMTQELQLCLYSCYCIQKTKNGVILNP